MKDIYDSDSFLEALDLLIGMKQTEHKPAHTTEDIVLRSLIESRVKRKLTKKDTNRAN